MKPLFRFAAKLLPQRIKDSLKEEYINRYHFPSMQWSLQNLRRIGFSPTRIVDIGAYEGEWTMLAKSIFPEASIFMVEAQEEKRAKLDTVVDLDRRRLQYEITLLGPAERDGVKFYRHDSGPTASSVLDDLQGMSPSSVVVCRMETLDGLLEKKGFGNPAFMKLDVQGYELEILKGGERALAAAEVVVMEVSSIELYQGTPLVPEVIDFMDSRGFRAYDICGLIRRPLDKALCQFDLMFAKADSSLFGSKAWGD